MKKISSFLLSLFLAFSMLCGCDAFSTGAGGNSASQESSANVEENSNLESDENSDEDGNEDGSSSNLEESSNSESDEENAEHPETEESDDLATCGHASSISPDSYGVVSTLSTQNEVLSENSTVALKGVFNGNDEDAIVYKGYIVWTFAELRLKDHNGKAVDLVNKSLVYDVKAKNCGEKSSIIVVAEDGTRSKEISFEFQNPNQTVKYISIEAMRGGWYRITIDLFNLVYDTDILRNGAEILLSFTNEECEDQEEDSIFYLDNAKIVKADNAVDPDEVTVYNPDGYYSKDKKLNVKFAGNWHLSVVLYLQFSSLCEDMGTKASSSTEYISSYNINAHYDEAFNQYSGYITTEKVDVLYLQGFNTESDVIALGQFLTKLHEVSPTTEVKILSWENAYAYQAAELYGLDLLDWKQAVLTLKTDYGFTEESLNGMSDSHGIPSPTDLSYCVNALMAYMDIYGKQPTFDAFRFTSNYITSDWPEGYEENEALQIIYSLASNLVLGIENDTPNTPNNPNVPANEESDIAVSGCIGTRAPENYGTACSDMYTQEEVVSKNSTSALKAEFDNLNADVYNEYMIWTWAEVSLDDYYGTTQDLSNKTLTYDMKTENCGIFSSYIIVDSQGNRTNEIVFEYNKARPYNFISCLDLNNGWYRITIDFSSTYNQSPILEDAAKILIMFTNQDCENPNGSHAFYLDNMQINNSTN